MATSDPPTQPETPRAHRFEALVVGGGPAGLAAASALAINGLRVGLVAPPHRPLGDRPDTRTAALFGGSIDLLRNLGVWETLAADCTPMTGIRIIDDTGRLLRAPEALFMASEVGETAFGYNVPNEPLERALRVRVATAGSGVTLIESAGVTRLAIAADKAVATTAEGADIAAQLIIAADGRRSLCRDAAGITTSTWTYPQSAVTAVFRHSRPHGQVSTELHRPAGPFTVVPMPGLASSLVWVEQPDEAKRLAALDDLAFRAAVAERLQGLLGAIGDIGPRGLFPLSGLKPAVFGANRVALVGEAGHVIPPIGAQGLNLGLRDAATIADCASEAAAHGRDIGGPDVVTAYSAARSMDVTSRLYMVDLLNRSLISELPVMHAARGLGIAALNWLPPLRRMVVREGMQPTRGLPSLMRQTA